MKATHASLINLLDGKKQFVIPIYQRTYSWKIKQCEQLLQDIIRVGTDTAQQSHFIGSVVYFQPDVAPTTSVPEYLVIDGQQRLTTVTLMLLALTHAMKKNVFSIDDESWEEIQDTYIINKHRKDTTRYKLLLTRKDNQLLQQLINKNIIDEESSSHVLQNYRFFKERINPKNADAIYFGIKKLLIVDVALEQNKDDPQLIFESLNSTGLDLSQSDLIRNYILMGQTSGVQQRLYENFWFPIEQSFGENTASLPLFVRDYLTMKQATIPKRDLVYETYKNYLRSTNAPDSIEEAVKSLYHFSRFYVRITLRKEKDVDLARKFREITKLKMETSYPYLLAVYDDYESEVITKADFLDILDILISYIVRRAICGIPTNSLNKTFAILHKKIKKESYLQSVKASFLLMSSYQRFPQDDEFTREFKGKDIYNLRIRNYLLEALENLGRKEPIAIKNYTIEHILPQNPRLADTWKEELGENWAVLRERYLHTIGNLTLTGYNSELSDRPFAEKKTINGGFNQSPLFLNESVRLNDKWNETAIVKRADCLAQRALEVWVAPSLPRQVLDKYVENNSIGVNNPLEQYEYLEGIVLGLYEMLKKRILDLDSAVTIKYTKKYIAFKAASNFVDVVPQKSGLRLSLNMPYEELIDPEGLATNISNLGRWGNGDVEVKLSAEDQLDSILLLIEQSFDRQMSVD